MRGRGSMIEPLHSGNRDRLKSAAAVILFHSLLGYAFVTGLGFDIATRTADALKLFDIRPAPPPPPVTEPPLPSLKPDAPEAEAAPPALRAQASPVVVPPPEVRIPVPPPLAAAPSPGAGSEASQGASDIPGPGTGSGGEGAGTGGGGSGTGSGGGGVAVRARHIQGALSGRDYPRAAKRVNAAGTVLVRYTVGTDGRVRGCTITQSSGNEDLDTITCRLIEKRFRYEPARDERGNPVADVQNGRHIWWTEPRKPSYPYVWEPPAEDRQEPSRR